MIRVRGVRAAIGTMLAIGAPALAQVATVGHHETARQFDFVLTGGAIDSTSHQVFGLGVVWPLSVTADYTAAGLFGADQVSFEASVFHQVAPHGEAAETLGHRLFYGTAGTFSTGWHTLQLGLVPPPSAVRRHGGDGHRDRYSSSAYINVSSGVGGSDILFSMLLYTGYHDEGELRVFRTPPLDQRSGMTPRPIGGVADLALDPLGESRLVVVLAGFTPDTLGPAQLLLDVGAGQELPVLDLGPADLWTSLPGPALFRRIEGVGQLASLAPALAGGRIIVRAATANEPATVVEARFGPVEFPTPPPCPADLNVDGNLDPDDLADFITCFFVFVQFPGLCPEADFNSDGNVDPDDLADFITAFFAGC